MAVGDFEAKEWREALPRIDDGTLQVIRLVVDERGNVVNAGGVVRRVGAPVPPVSTAVPDAVVTVPTLRGSLGSGGSVQVVREGVRHHISAGSGSGLDCWEVDSRVRGRA